MVLRYVRTGRSAEALEVEYGKDIFFITSFVKKRSGLSNGILPYTSSVKIWWYLLIPYFLQASISMAIPMIFVSRNMAELVIEQSTWLSAAKLTQFQTLTEAITIVDVVTEDHRSSFASQKLIS